MTFLRLWLAFIAAGFLYGQATPGIPGPQQPGDAIPSQPESIWDRIWISGQANFIRQQHGSFPTAYSGPNSFSNLAEHDTSRVLTLYTGFQRTNHLEFLLDVESAGGTGLSNTLGLAGFTNVDVVRNPTLGAAPYVGRVMIHYVLPLSKESAESERNAFSLFPRLPVRRLELRAGKMSTVDFFDQNSVGSDSHTQFMNWTAVNNGAYDYAADTRGYTYGIYLEYDDKWGSLRLAEMLMPKVANGISLDWNVARAGGTNLELDLNPTLLQHHPTNLRFLTYWNRGNMGSYREAIDNGILDITATRQQGRSRIGFGINVEQAVAPELQAYGRGGWSDGRNEDFAYTEVDGAASIGSLLRGKWWHRPPDKLGEAFLVNGISRDHARYLQLGGLGFLLGDGNLTYGRERIFETFYTADIWRGTYVSVDWQHVTNPGYNQVRGPASILSFRLHLEGAVPLEKLAR